MGLSVVKFLSTPIFWSNFSKGQGREALFKNLSGILPERWNDLKDKSEVAAAQGFARAAAVRQGNVNLSHNQRQEKQRFSFSKFKSAHVVD
jgi:hypothetical protein